MAQEIAHRKAEYRKDLGPLRATVFRQRELEPQHKVTFVDSLVASSLLHNAAVWQPLTLGQAAAVDHAM
eukprot:9678383-Heterocapsa_arctica.AAC.1